MVVAHVKGCAGPASDDRTPSLGSPACFARKPLGLGSGTVGGRDLLDTSYVGYRDGTPTTNKPSIFTDQI